MTTLEEFINKNISVYEAKRVRPTNEYVEREHFDTLYLRMSIRYIGGQMFAPVVDIANVVVDETKRGQQLLTKLLIDIVTTWPSLHIYMESVQNSRLPKFLKDFGFEYVNATGIHEGEEHDISPSYFLKAGTVTITERCESCGYILDVTQDPRHLDNDWCPECEEGDVLHMFYNEVQAP